MWVHRGFKDFAKGQFGSGGDNLYVNAKGEIETIHRFDLNNDGSVDIVLPNSHGYEERAPTWVYTKKDSAEVAGWERQQLPNDSGWMSRVVDLDGDGYNDLVVANGENGVTSELDSYVYWGGPNGLTGEYIELPTAGAYDVAAYDLTGNGLKDLIFPSAWVDHHNPGRSRLIQVYEQREPRKFVESTERYGLVGVAATSIACEDLNGDGIPEIVVANYQNDFEYDTDSFVYWGTETGFDTESPLRLPTHYALQVILGDLNNDGWKEIVFVGGNEIYIYWNDFGTFAPDRRTVVKANGISTMFCLGAIRADIADVDGDGRNELVIATIEGLEIRTQDDLTKAKQKLPIEYCSWVSVADVDGDGRPDLIASRYENGKFYESESAIFWNGPDGFSSNRATWLDTAGAMGCTTGELNGDGHLEIIFNNTMQSWSQSNPDLPAYVYLGNDKHEYGPERRLELPTGGGTNTYNIADLDQDGYPELVITTPKSLRIFPGSLDGPQPDNYQDLPNYGNNFTWTLVGDLNKDGWLDLIGVAYSYDDKPETMAKSSVIYWGGPKGFSGERSTVLPTFTNGAGFLADVNKDGWLDFIYGDRRGFLGIYLGGPEGFSPDRMMTAEIPGANPPLTGVVNCADIDGDGWLDIIYAYLGHYTRSQSGFYIFYGGPDGYSSERMEFHPTEASSALVSVADVNNDGTNDLLVPSYSTQYTRDLPAFIFWGDGDSFDFDNPFVIPCEASCAFMTVDITGNGYRDVLAVCHRGDLGHQVDSLLFWNGPEGLSFDRMTRLPGLGPHLTSPRDFGNTYTRGPEEYYVSPARDLGSSRPTRIHWDADVPSNTSLTFQLRWAHDHEGLRDAPWCGPEGAGSSFSQSGHEVSRFDPDAHWLQYRAIFSSLNGCGSPKLREVTIEGVS